ncbi:sulfatase-like hydrolase/transferase [Alcaligenaceae bacterium CGII-47]|nr:sulfatase-like hydrolase/transferase [Alcaligenaceae bacterium CGII-47]
MDDVGIDQMRSFGYGGVNAPKMPNIDAVADAGIRFRNTWSEPECSPARASFFVGRHPTRTNINQALGPNDLANAQLSPYETTAPQLLRKAGYENAMFGKFHLAGPENNQAGFSTPSVFGLDHFYGWVGGLPESIDTTAGGAGTVGDYQCGFVPGALVARGAASGACYTPDGQCTHIVGSPTGDAAGLTCVTQGGVLDPGQICKVPKPASVDLDRYNAYYVSPLVIIHDGQVEEVPKSDLRARGYRTTIETDAAIAWIKSRSAAKPWMATVSYTSAHTPWQTPPRRLLPSGGSGLHNGADCTSTAVVRGIQNDMTEALDTEFGRLLVETGLATRKADGTLHYDPKASNTVIVIVGDNGTLALAVKTPFDASRAKGTAYQTGVWVPLIVAGPQVADPGREVEHMVSGVDLFELFGELAGINVHQAVPRPLDSVGLKAYLMNAGQASQRKTNFTIGGLNQQANGGRNGPCVIPSSGGGGTCTQIPTTKKVCEDNMGFWWGEGHGDITAEVGAGGAPSYPTCAAVNQARYDFNAAARMYDILPDESVGVRDERYKLVRNTFTRFYPVGAPPIRKEIEYELYEIDQAKLAPKLDEVGDSKINADGTIPGGAAPWVGPAYADLRDRLDRMMKAAVKCPGDGNIDGVVDAEDLKNWSRINRDWGKSSVYDFVGPSDGPPDGITDGSDAVVINRNLQVNCEYPPSVN